jgi:hypothetical protein
MCQHYPSVLDDLTPVEECLIARSHPLGVILKLRPGGRSSPIRTIQKNAMTVARRFVGSDATSSTVKPSGTFAIKSVLRTAYSWNPFWV